MSRSAWDIQNDRRSRVGAAAKFGGETLCRKNRGRPPLQGGIFHACFGPLTDRTFSKALRSAAHYSLYRRPRRGPDRLLVAYVWLGVYEFAEWGHVAEWLRNGLQNRVHQFNSGRGLHSKQLILLAFIFPNWFHRHRFATGLPPLAPVGGEFTSHVRSECPARP